MQVWDDSMNVPAFYPNEREKCDIVLLPHQNFYHEKNSIPVLLHDGHDGEGTTRHSIICLLSCRHQSLVSDCRYFVRTARTCRRSTELEFLLPDINRRPVSACTHSRHFESILRSFPASNRAVRITSPTSSDTNYIYQTVSGTGAYYDGSALRATGSDIVFQYTNPQTIFKYPVTYNWSDADFFSSSMVTSGGGITFTNYRYGPQQAVADEYETLQLPWATYTNCIRIKYRQLITDSLVMTGIPLPADIQTTIKTMYAWIQLVNGAAVERMTMTYDTITDGTSTTCKTYCQLNDSTTTGLTRASATRQMNVYPNPTTHSIFLPEFGNSFSAYRTDILDLQGKIVFSLTNEESPTQKPVAIPVQQLSPETYIVRLSRPDISYYAKFIKQ